MPAVGPLRPDNVPYLTMGQAIARYGGGGGPHAGMAAERVQPADTMARELKRLGLPRSAAAKDALARELQARLNVILKSDSGKGDADSTCDAAQSRSDPAGDESNAETLDVKLSDEQSSLMEYREMETMADVSTCLRSGGELASLTEYYMGEALVGAGSQTAAVVMESKYTKYKK